MTRPFASFTDDERAAIRQRREYQPASELAAAFSTTSHVIAAICRGGEDD